MVFWISFFTQQCIWGNQLGKIGSLKELKNCNKNMWFLYTPRKSWTCQAAILNIVKINRKDIREAHRRENGRDTLNANNKTKVTCQIINKDSILIKPSNTTKYVSLLSLLLSRTTCFGPLSDHHQVFKS